MENENLGLMHMQFDAIYRTEKSWFSKEQIERYREDELQVIVMTVAAQVLKQDNLESLRRCLAFNLVTINEILNDSPGVISLDDK